MPAVLWPAAVNCAMASASVLHTSRRLVVPRRHALPPPQLARNAPVAHVLHPVAVGVRTLRMQLHAAVVHHLQGGFGQLHLHEPLEREARLDHRIGALAVAHLVRDVLGLHQPAPSPPAPSRFSCAREAVLADVELRRGAQGAVRRPGCRWSPTCASCPARSRSGRAQASPSGSPYRTRAPRTHRRSPGSRGPISGTSTACLSGGVALVLRDCTATAVSPRIVSGRVVAMVTNSNPPSTPGSG
jgi:hypothetical protein